METYKKLSEEIYKIPMIDVHTHIDLSHLSARGLNDILLYHMLISELYSAGCPDPSRLSEFPDEKEASQRLKNAVPFVKYIKYSSCYSIAKTIMKDLYDFDCDISTENYIELDSRIKEKYKKGYADEILKRANITALNTEYCRTHGLSNSKFFYSLEWAFFTRNQYGVYDAPLTELEIASSQTEPEGPIPVTFDETQYASRPRLNTVEQVDEAMENYVSKIPFDIIVSMPTHFSTDIHYGDVTKDQMSKALKNRKNAGSEERDAYANYINNKYFEVLSTYGKKAAVSISLGAEPLKYETAIKLNADTFYAIESLANRYPNVDFILFNACDYQDTTLCSVIRENQNIYAAGFWWHSFYPSAIMRSIRSRLERIPINKWFGYFSDAYCVDWAYGKSRMVRDCYAMALSELVDQKFLSMDDALEVSKRLFYQNAKEYFKL